MGDFLIEFKRFFRKGDMVLLALCLTATVFGLLVIASATNAVNSTRYIILQGFSAVIGVLFYAVMSSIDVDTFSEHRTALVIFNVLLLSLLIPFGVNTGGNKSWIKLPLVPFNIQPAEICKVTYILIMASVMNSHQNRISSIPSVMHMVVHLGLIVGLNMVRRCRCVTDLRIYLCRHGLFRRREPLVVPAGGRWPDCRGPLCMESSDGDLPEKPDSGAV